MPSLKIYCINWLVVMIFFLNKNKSLSFEMLKRMNQYVLNVVYRDLMAYFKISLDETSARDWCPGS